MAIPLNRLTDLSRYDSFHVMADGPYHSPTPFDGLTDPARTYIVVDRSDDSSATLSWAIGAGGGDDVFDLRRYREGNLLSGPGEDTFLLGLGTGQSRFHLFGRIDLDPLNDRIVVAATAGSFEVEVSRSALDWVLKVGDHTFLMSRDPAPLIESGGIIAAPGLAESGPPDGLADLGGTLDPAEGRSAGGYGNRISDDANSIRLDRAEAFNADLGFGADLVRVTGSGGGWVGLGGTAGIDPTRVVTSHGGVVVVPGSPPTADGDADTLILTRQARGVWYAGQIDGNDRIVLEGFDRIGSILDLQLRAFALGEGVPFVEYRLAPGLILRTTARADQFLFAEDLSLTLTGRGGADRLEGSDGHDRLAGRGGADTLTGGEGGDTFLFARGGGNDVVTDWGDGDRLRFLSGSDSLADLRFTQRGDDLLIRHDGGAILLRDIDRAEIDRGDFVF